jgi:argininosuccinate synthase
MQKINKVVLAYSGGLDTSVILKWLKEKYNCQIIAFVADVGQGDDFAAIKKRAFKTGASKVIVQDLKEEFVREYVFPSLSANAIYEGKYLLATALSRPLIAKKMVEIAVKEKADAVAHGCTGKGNDQVRFEVTIMAKAPSLEILAPVREWELKSREEEIEYAKKHNIPLTVKKEKIYSIDKNLWGISIECGILEDPWREPPADAYQMTLAPEKAPNKATYVEIYFDKGIPKKINGENYTPVTLIEKLNKIGGVNGIGRADMIEDRLVGIKSREVYESPAGTILYLAHRELENLTLDRDTLHYKELISPRYAQLVYWGLWFSPLKEAFDAFINQAQEEVTGTVKLKLYKGNCIVVGRKSPHSLYKENLATYTLADVFDHQSAKGFIELWGLPLKVKALRDKKHS